LSVSNSLVISLIKAIRQASSLLSTLFKNGPEKSSGP
jgi:hypothetical protein